MTVGLIPVTGGGQFEIPEQNPTKERSHRGISRKDRPLLFISSLMGVTAGLAIVLAHNVWSGGVLPIIVSLFGWASLIKGMLLLVVSPETGSRVFIVVLGYEQHPILFAALALLLGAYMTFLGFNLNTHSLE